jgi:MFS family permease
MAARAALASRDFRLLQLARFCSIVALQLTHAAAGWQILHASERALDLGFVGLAQFIPAVGLSLVAGHAADRYDRKRVLAACNAAYAIVAALLAAYALTGSSSTLPIYAALVALGAGRAFAGPAGQALLPDVVPPEHFSSAVAWSSSIWQAAMVAGPMLAGVAIGVGGAKAAFAFAAVAAAVGAVAAVAIRARPFAVSDPDQAPVVLSGPDQAPTESKEISLRVVFAGVRYVWERKEILGAISLDLFAVLFGGAVALFPIFARDVLHAGPWGFGMLRAAPGAGAIVTALVLAYRPLKRRAGVVMFACVALFGAAMIVFAVSKVLWISVVALAISGAADMVSAVVRHTLVQVTTPREMRGRVSAVNLVFIGASNELGEFESGVTAQWLGAVPSVVVGGVGTLIVVAIWALAFPALRKVESLDEPATE